MTGDGLECNQCEFNSSILYHQYDARVNTFLLLKSIATCSPI